MFAHQEALQLIHTQKITKFNRSSMHNSKLRTQLKTSRSREKASFCHLKRCNTFKLMFGVGHGVARSEGHFHLIKCIPFVKNDTVDFSDDVSPILHCIEMRRIQEYIRQSLKTGFDGYGYLLDWTIIRPSLHYLLGNPNAISAGKFCRSRIPYVLMKRE